ncbi:MAG: chemotaxis protein CheX [Nitrospinae bacterium]|nr:chemotaxis protein CheX [Nitrospinota bacterium]
MQFLEKEIQHCTRLVYSTLLDFEVHSSPGHYKASPTSTVTGSVHITGEWNGTILLSLPALLVDKITEQLFSIEPGKSSNNEREDAVGELINMIGGNIKALLPEPSKLSVPTIAMEGNDPKFPPSKEVTHCQFEYQNELFGLTLYEEV